MTTARAREILGSYAAGMTDAEVEAIVVALTIAGEDHIAACASEGRIDGPVAGPIDRGAGQGLVGR